MFELSDTDTTTTVARETIKDAVSAWKREIFGHALVDWSSFSEADLELNGCTEIPARLDGVSVVLLVRRV